MIENEIISDVADFYGITASNILSKRRVRRYVDARTVVCYLLRYVCTMTTTEIGDVVHLDHTSVVYHNKKAQDWLNMPKLNDKGAKAIIELKKRYGNE